VTAARGRRVGQRRRARVRTGAGAPAPTSRAPHGGRRGTHRHTVEPRPTTQAAIGEREESRLPPGWRAGSALEARRRSAEERAARGQGSGVVVRRGLLGSAIGVGRVAATLAERRSSITFLRAHASPRDQRTRPDHRGRADDAREDPATGGDGSAEPQEAAFSPAHGRSRRFVRRARADRLGTRRLGSPRRTRRCRIGSPRRTSPLPTAPWRGNPQCRRGAQAPGRSS
jgi:hypothetical protein